MEDNIKLRIVLSLDKNTEKIIKKYNKKINKNINYDIEFKENCIPHITLISGILKNKSDFEKILQIITKSIENNIKQKLEINFNDFYYSQDFNWLFLGLEDNQILLDFIGELRQNLANYLDISDARHLHVTVAKSSELNKQKTIINNLNVPNSFFAENIAIGLSGIHGTLTNIIENFNIKIFKNC